MVDSGSFSYPGRCHRFLTELNEDVVLERDCGAHRVAVLCDGAGGCPQGKAAARLTARAAADFLSLRFRLCLSERPESLRLALSHRVTEVLARAAEASNLPPSQFGCTLLAAAMDGGGRWCLFHLGDGAAIGRLNGSGWRIFSYPQRGLLPGSTSLTMNGSMVKNLRFCRQDTPASRSLVLMSDGALALCPTISAFPPAPERFYGDVLEPPEDDCSAVWLTARSGAPGGPPQVPPLP